MIKNNGLWVAFICLSSSILWTDLTDRVGVPLMVIPYGLLFSRHILPWSHKSHWPFLNRTCKELWLIVRYLDEFSHESLSRALYWDYNRCWFLHFQSRYLTRFVSAKPLPSRSKTSNRKNILTLKPILALVCVLPSHAVSHSRTSWANYWLLWYTDMQRQISDYCSCADLHSGVISSSTLIWLRGIAKQYTKG